MKIIVYSRPDCPMCTGLKMLLDENKIEYEVCEDKEKMKALGFTSLPMLVTEMTYKEALAWVKEKK